MWRHGGRSEFLNVLQLLHRRIEWRRWNRRRRFADFRARRGRLRGHFDARRVFAEQGVAGMSRFTKDAVLLTGRRNVESQIGLWLAGGRARRRAQSGRGNRIEAGERCPHLGRPRRFALMRCRRNHDLLTVRAADLMAQEFGPNRH